MKIQEYIASRKESLLDTKQQIEENAKQHGYQASTTPAVLCLRSRLEELELLLEWLKQQ
jgi:hypothetical protein